MFSAADHPLLLEIGSEAQLIEVRPQQGQVRLQVRSIGWVSDELAQVLLPQVLGKLHQIVVVGEVLEDGLQDVVDLVHVFLCTNRRPEAAVCFFA